jgi:hypothetical protein
MGCNRAFVSNSVRLAMFNAFIQNIGLPKPTFSHLLQDISHIAFIALAEV